MVGKIIDKAIFLAIILGLSLIFGCNGSLANPQEERDTIAPIPSTNALASVSCTAVITVTWVPAEDNSSSQNELEYRVVCSTTGNIDTLANALANLDESKSSAWMAGITSGCAINLSFMTTYYLNVLVRDKAGNIAAYGMINTSTAEYYILDNKASVLFRFIIPSDTAPGDPADNIGRVKIRFYLTGLSVALPASSIRIDPPSNNLLYQYHDYTAFSEQYNIDAIDYGYKAILRKLINPNGYNNRFEIEIINLPENDDVNGYWNTFDSGLPSPNYWEIQVRNIPSENYEFTLESLTAHAVTDPNPQIFLPAVPQFINCSNDTQCPYITAINPQISIVNPLKIAFNKMEVIIW